MSTDQSVKKDRVQSLPVHFNGVKVGNASSKEKAIEVLEKSVVAFMGGNPGIIGRQHSWNKLSQIFGYDSFDEDVLEDHSDAEGFAFKITPRPN